jgi:hypothetical protein
MRCKFCDEDVVPEKSSPTGYKHVSGWTICTNKVTLAFPESKSTEVPS